MDYQYWDANVRRPAVAFLARMRHSVQPALEPLSEGAKASLANVEAALGVKHRQNAGRAESPKKKKRKRAKESPPQEPPMRKAKVAAALEEKFTNKEHPKKWGGLFHTTQEGKEICYVWAKGEDPDVCDEPCSKGRVHRCQICLGSHQNRECKKQPAKSQGKGASKK